MKIAETVRVGNDEVPEVFTLTLTKTEHSNLLQMLGSVNDGVGSNFVQHMWVKLCECSGSPDRRAPNSVCFEGSLKCKPTAEPKKKKESVPEATPVPVPTATEASMRLPNFSDYISEVYSDAVNANTTAVDRMAFDIGRLAEAQTRMMAQEAPRVRIEPQTSPPPVPSPYADAFPTIAEEAFIASARPRRVTRRAPTLSVGTSASPATLA